MMQAGTMTSIRSQNQMGRSCRSPCSRGDAQAWHIKARISCRLTVACPCQGVHGACVFLACCGCCCWLPAGTFAVPVNVSKFLDSCSGFKPKSYSTIRSAEDRIVMYVYLNDKVRFCGPEDRGCVPVRLLVA
jgi:hypothetical protein